MVKRLFVPDLILPNIYALTPSFLHEKEICALFLDIDNTLVTYGDPEPTKAVAAWISDMQKGGIQVAIISNNEKERVERFCKSLHLFYTYKSKKPSRRGVRICCSRFSVLPERCAVVGDQIFTDVLCGNRAGAFTVLVKPLPYPENRFFRIKRFFEKPFIRFYYRLQKHHLEEKNDDSE